MIIGIKLLVQIQKMKKQIVNEYNSSQNMISFYPSKNNNNLNDNKLDYLRKPSIKDVRKKLNPHHT